MITELQTFIGMLVLTYKILLVQNDEKFNYKLVLKP